MNFDSVFKKVVLHEISLSTDFKFPEDNDPFSHEGEMGHSDHDSDSDEFFRLFTKCHKIANEKKMNWDSIKIPVTVFCNVVTARHDMHVDEVTDIIHIGEYLSINIKGRPIGGSAGHFGHEFNDTFSISAEKGKSHIDLRHSWEDQIDLFMKDLAIRFDHAKDKHKHFRPEDHESNDDWL